ncbi:MAG: tRNA-dihydrouridine synthase [Pseudolabrys sp.]|nr:tRNA-dihydrouridine synthase [Pseudolabrys sp.]
MTARAAVSLGAVDLKSPLICGSGEHLMYAQGIRQALAAGAAAVVSKSVNESEAARRQLDRTDYALLDSEWRRLPWDFNPPADASLFCRSGLAQQSFDEWLAMIAPLDREAKAQDAYVIASLILADLDHCVAMAKRIEEAGLRILELNIGAPHGNEAAPGAIVLERDSARVRTIVSRVRAAVKIPLWIKLTGQSEDVAALTLAAKEAGADAVTVMGRFIAFLPDIESFAPTLGTNAAFGGPWALPLTCRWLAQSRRAVGKSFPLLGTNGARTGLDIARFLLSGASAVQVTSAVFTGGFGVITRMRDDFAAYLDRKQVSAADLIGRAADQQGSYAEQQSRPGYWEQFVVPEARA